MVMARSIWICYTIPRLSHRQLEPTMQSVHCTVAVVLSALTILMTLKRQPRARLQSRAPQASSSHE